MKVSLCIVCKGRLHTLRQTLKRNILDNFSVTSYGPILEVALLDWNSEDGLEAWVRNEIMNNIKFGRLTYYKEKTERYYHAARTKNVAALLATGDIVCNIDADVFTGKGYAGQVEALVEGGAGVIRAPWGHWGVSESSGLGGMIALRRADFLKLHGYDESFEGWGYDDTDLVDRATASGLKLANLLSEGCRDIPTPDAEKVSLMDPETVLKGPWESNASNAARVIGRRNAAMIPRIKPGDLVNRDGWGKATVYKNFEDVPIQVQGPV